MEPTISIWGRKPRKSFFSQQIDSVEGGVVDRVVILDNVGFVLVGEIRVESSTIDVWFNESRMMCWSFAWYSYQLK